jgi:hypothetical protein
VWEIYFITSDFGERADELEFFESKESLTTMDWTLTLGNIIAHPLSDEKLGLQGSMITTLLRQI